MPAWNASDTSQPDAAAARWPVRTSLSTAALMRLVQRDTVHGTLPRALLVVLAEHLHARGLPASHLIDADLWPLEQEPLGRLPVERFCRLLTRAALRLQDEHLGLQLGQSMQVHQLGALGYLLQASATACCMTSTRSKHGSVATVSCCAGVWPMAVPGRCSMKLAWRASCRWGVGCASSPPGCCRSIS
jgi:Arabinose-binding domain of AraC transcription regulator, N-term